MGGLILLRWELDSPTATPRQLILGTVAPVLSDIQELRAADASYYVSDHGTRAWLTIVAPTSLVASIRDAVATGLGEAMSLETDDDALTEPDAEWYRQALQRVSEVALDVIASGQVVPMSEHEAFLDPMSAVPVLMPFVWDSSAAYRSMCHAYEDTERFWLEFFKWGPASHLSPPGHWLWNLAG